MPEPAAASVAVIGGGLAGLVAAHELSKGGVDVHLFEKSAKVGGKIATTVLDGVLVPTAADAFLARQPQMIELATELGLGDQLIEPAARDARIFRDDSLHPLPPNLLGIPTDLDALADSGLVSADGMQRAKLDLTNPDDRPVGDESVGSLVRRRLGDEVLEYVVDPLLGGINAGDSDRLSIETGAIQIGAARSLDSSLTEGARALRDQSGVNPESPVFLTHIDGVGVVVAALERSVEKTATIHRRAAVGVERTDGGWRVDGQIFDRIVAATEAYAAAALLGDLAPETAARLDAIDYSSVAMVLLMLPAGSVHLPAGISGVLVPRNEGLLVTAVSIATNKWPHLVPDGRQILRVSVGRRTDSRFTELDDRSLTSEVVTDLSSIIELAAEPLATEVIRWTRSLPQYDVDHGHRIEELEFTLANEAPGIVLAGAYLRGLGLPACVQSGRDAAERIVRSPTP